MYLSVAIFLWYLSSALCNSTSKHLLLEFEIPYLLSSVQFVLAYVCSLVMRKYFKGSGFPPTPKSEEQQTWLYQVAICFALGFTLVNTGLHVMHVSINETLRAGEPVVSVLLAVVWLKEAHISRTLVFTLIPIVCGIALSSYSNADFKFQGLALMFGANLAFSYRSILVKRLRLKYDMTASDILLYSLRYGSLLQIAAAFGSLLYSPSVPVWVDSNQPALMLLNGCCFFAYNQLSFYVLSRTDIISHSICNAFRRVVTILFAVMYFDLKLSALNGVGMCIGSIGVISYSRVVAQEQGKDT